MTRGWWEATVLAACILLLHALQPKSGREVRLDPAIASEEAIREEAAASLNATLEAWLQSYESILGDDQRRKVAQRWDEVQAGIRDLQARLERLQHIPEQLDGSFEEAEVVSRSLVFDSQWGREALEKLHTWRSTLFQRMAQRYSQEERKLSQNGTRYVPRAVVEPKSWARYDVAKASVGCPYGQVERVGGDGDGSKVLCVEGLLNTPGCIIYSLGSNGQYEFEEDMLMSTTCEVHTLDCTWAGRSLDGNRRHFYHQVCLGPKTVTVVEETGRKLEYWDYPTVLKSLGHKRKRVALLKIDIEGYEFDVLAGWHERDGCSLPIQVAMEVHYQRFYNMMGGARVADTDFSHLFWPKHSISMGELSTWFGHFANLGYAITSRDDNPLGADCCSEFTLIKVEQPGDCPSLS